MSNEKELCKICEEGYLINCNDYIALPESGLTFLVPSEYSICDYCNSEQTSMDQCSVNVAHMLHLKKRINELYCYIKIYTDRKYHNKRY